MALNKGKGKRSAPAAHGPSKKRKVTTTDSKSRGAAAKKKSTDKGKEKASDRATIPIPSIAHDDDVNLSDQDLEVFNEFGKSVSFLQSLDHAGIMRSKKETVRLHQLNKPARKPAKQDSLPSVDSHDEDEGSWSSGIGDDPLSDSDDEQDKPTRGYPESDRSDAEMPYEMAPRKRLASWEDSEKREIQRLPIKLPDGRIQGGGAKRVLVAEENKLDSESDSEDNEEVEQAPLVREDASTGARFGRPAVLDVLGTKSRKHRILAAKQQIAGICQEILADPENSLGLLKRLYTFSLKEVSTATHPEPVANDLVIRKLSILSLLAIFKDIIPGYRIRALTDIEKAEKVSQMVAKTREWEQGLVSVYQSYLRGLEAELKVRSDLADTALHCMCTLLTEVTHFNFRVNLMTCVVARLSKKSWDQSSDLCLKTLISVFQEDLTGEASLEIVRLLNRMVKERRFKIHPEVLSCLLHLRLRTELGVRASDSAADKATPSNDHGGKAVGRKAKKGEKPHLSKKAKKTLKEKKEIDKEMREAEAEVDKEERAVTQTETLKLLFALYFRILKNPTPTPLLPAALSGISRFAHLVNIDFFKDLLQVLKQLITLEADVDEDGADDTPHDSSKDFKNVSHRLHCIVTAFELLSGQGEALNIDLSDFVTRLYAMILPLTLVHDIDTRLPSSTSAGARFGKTQSVADMLFRALNIVFSPRGFGSAAPPWRSAAFAKRLLSASLHWPPVAAIRAIDFVRGLVAKDRKLEALLSTEDRIFDGIYRPDVDDPQLCHPFGTSFYEIQALHERHWDPRVRKEAKKLVNFSAS